MTDLRKAAEAVLEAWDWDWSEPRNKALRERMEALRKAAEMALEALSEYTGVVTSGTDPTKWDEVVDGGGPAREAIQALRQALAQPDEVLAEREACAKVVEADGLARGDEGLVLIKAAGRIRSRGEK